MNSNDSLTAVSGVRVGHVTDAAARTGCTVVVLPEPNVVTAEIRGAAPATREFGLLGSGMTVQQAQAILLTGGSAFGLAAADGVMDELEALDLGHPTPAGVVPIVPAAALFDLAVGEASVRPTAADGAAAFRVATTDPVAGGQIGAGTGATCGKWRGQRLPAGVGSAAVTVGNCTVAALVVVNALGDIFDLHGASLTGGPAVPGQPATAPEAHQNTTLAVVVTDADLTRPELSRLLVRAHDAFGVCLRPAHTGFDGDICFAASVGQAQVPLAFLAEATFEAVGLAIAKVADHSEPPPTS